jgi:hypothetical protein
LSEEAFSCHREERSDVAIYGDVLNEIATLRSQ